MSSQQPQPVSNPEKKVSRSPWLFFYLGLLLMAGVAFGVWKLVPKRECPELKEDLVAAVHANSRGVGFMDRFDYERAVEALEEAEKRAPSWVPARINLGIALLNESHTFSSDQKKAREVLDRAQKLFKEVLTKVLENPYALYCSGIIHYYRGERAQALPFFKEVTRVDPNDAHAWFFLGLSQENYDDSPVSLECFQKALNLNPYLNQCRYRLAQHSSLFEDNKKRRKLFDEFEQMHSAGVYDSANVAYGEMGKYGSVLEKPPERQAATSITPLFQPTNEFTVRLAEGTTWATKDKVDELHREVRSRFGGSVLLLDYNRDGRTDILLLSAVVRGGKTQDLLLRNDGVIEGNPERALVGPHERLP